MNKNPIVKIRQYLAVRCNFGRLRHRILHRKKQRRYLNIKRSGRNIIRKK